MRDERGDLKSDERRTVAEDQSPQTWRAVKRCGREVLETQRVAHVQPEESWHPHERSVRNETQLLRVSQTNNANVRHVVEHSGSYSREAAAGEVDDAHCERRSLCGLIGRSKLTA